MKNESVKKPVMVNGFFILIFHPGQEPDNLKWFIQTRMKLKRKNAATAKNFDIPLSFLYMAPKLYNKPISNAPNPEIISSSDAFEKTRNRKMIGYQSLQIRLTNCLNVS
ncbi:hypothetical protein KEH51_23185 [[Brevibacterium] frigoritolerans]|uniref:Uncharacterized protein n=1 Tax=Peribacillus frigoritolerans TaxID=450367 RepID=A0A941FTH6_9BACI|nr:hypothetical protein [Peribacillus frigoritolerans]